ncbi:SGNH/GDSL hydrolase family protein [Kitasatospora sp. NPDC094011]|uniref:SGNH/GDSL hydrolase family protein n=1 Tax=Kitasatospora sp. NPDC094011 TaxID=3364090 RepID=UPI003825CBED
MRRFPSRLAVAGTAVALAVGLTTPTTTAQAAVKPATRAGVLKWSTLGDSYTAGLIAAAGTLTEPQDGCARTTGSYPELLRRELGPLVDLHNPSCSGATTLDVYANKQIPQGRPLPPLGTDPNAPYPAVPPQIDAVDPNTDVITVGIGGNDLGFGQILKDCIELGAANLGLGTPCKDKYDVQLPGRFAQLRNSYDTMLGALQQQAPNARVITVGYPHVIPEDATRCRYGDPLQFATFTAGDLGWARTRILEPLNLTIEQQSSAQQDTYVDLYPGSAGHSVCDRDHWLDGLLSSVVPLQYAVIHPNAEGQAFMATQVKATVLGG